MAVLFVLYVFVFEVNGSNYREHEPRNHERITNGTIWRLNHALSALNLTGYSIL